MREKINVLIPRKNLNGAVIFFSNISTRPLHVTETTLVSFALGDRNDFGNHSNVERWRGDRKNKTFHNIYFIVPWKFLNWIVNPLNFMWWHKKSMWLWCHCIQFSQFDWHFCKSVIFHIFIPIWHPELYSSSIVYYTSEAWSTNMQQHFPNKCR